MEIDIINKKENKALYRTEVKFDCIYEGKATPKILDVKNKLVALLDTKKDLIVIDSLQPRYGETKASGYAKIYDTKDNLLDIETEHVLAKNKLIGDESEEEVVTEESTEEKSDNDQSVEEVSVEEIPADEEPVEEEINESEESNDSEEDIAENDEESEESD